MKREFKYDSLDHFDYFMFYRRFLIVACDKEDSVIGYIVITDGNEFGQLYVNPKHRATDVIHLLRNEAEKWSRKWGFKFVWGVCYDRVAKFHKRLAREYGYKLAFVESPEDRDDGQWKIVVNIEDADEDNNRST